MKNAHMVALVAGHSGGHIIPGMLVAAVYQKKYNAELLFFSTTKHLDATIAKNFQPHTYVAFTIVTGVRLWKIVQQLWGLLTAWIKSSSILSQSKPILVISTGGLVSVPVCLAAYCLNIPIHLIELNVIPGKAVKFLVKIATVVSVVFHQTIKYIPNAIHLEYPLRFTVEHKLISQHHARMAMALPLNKFTLLILGGSQGSYLINILIQEFFSRYPDLRSKISILHQAGHNHQQEIKAWYDTMNIQASVFAFHHELHNVYQAADLVICRAGAGTLHELAFFAKKTFVIPLVTSTTDHQVANAHAMEERYRELFKAFDQDALKVNPEQLYVNVVQEYEKYVMNQMNAQVDLLSHQQQLL